MNACTDHTLNGGYGGSRRLKNETEQKMNEIMVNSKAKFIKKKGLNKSVT